VDALDDGIRVGDANCDGVVNMGDVTAVENMILGFISRYQQIRRFEQQGTVNMGTVVKIDGLSWSKITDKRSKTALTKLRQGRPVRT